MNFEQEQKKYFKLLTGRFEEKKSEKKSYSLRAYARDLKMSPALLSLLLSGKRQLSAEQILKLKNTFPDQPTSAVGLKPSSAKPRFQSPEFVNVKVPGEFHWYDLAILDLMTLKGFQSDVKWISQQLKLDSETVVDSIDKLLSLGLAAEKNGTLIKTRKKIQLDPSHSMMIIRNMHRAFIGKAIEELSHTDDQSFQNRSISATLIAANPKHLEEAKRRIDAFQQEIADLLTKGACTTLYQFNLQLFPLIKK